MMINKQVNNNFSTTKPLTIFSNYVGLTGSVSNVQFPVRHGNNFLRKKSTGSILRAASKTIKAQVTAVPETATTIKGAVTVKVTVKDTITDIITISRDDITDMLGKTLLIELVSTDLDPNTGEDKATIKAYAHKVAQDKFNAKYEVNFVIPPGFGNVGAILVENEHHSEMFLDDVVLSGFKDGPVHISCKSWIHSKFDDKTKRVFFTNKSYLPSETPEGLRRLREKDLEILRGNGEGERKKFERVYDYDTYNDLGNPDKPDLVRPVIGTKELPYPRRCRTGRPRTKKDPLSETRSNSVYVPRDESFSEIKQVEFQAKTLKSVLHALVPTLENTFQDPDLGFPYFTAIDTLFNEGVNVPPHKNQGKFQPILPRIIKAVENQKEDVLLFETPEMIDRDKFSWFRDEEFSRQVLAGLNPYSIELVREWPLKSKLDPNIYGPAESKITKELIEQEIRGFMTVEEALKQKKLYMLDYHDLYLPYVNKVRALKNTTLYGSRTIFFLTREGTLRPIAIELTRPKSPNNPEQWKEVFTPKWDATSCWLWRMAKSHVCAHDSGFHQLVVHWLRTHACTEPYIIAANRQLSTMHPIYRLLHPHFRYTMEINALAREQLISAGGVIEGAFFPGKYAVELSAVAYGALWRFDQEALPADLIRRGMAVEDPTAKHGLKLAIEDYPFANDGLILWDNIKQWVTDYVSHYYPDEKIVKTDTELQNWWTEVRTKGHADKKDEPWWPVLNTPADLIQVLTTIIWVTAGHHAAVNFGQYMFAGYFPNRPTITRTNMPTEDPTDEALKRFLKRPEGVLLESFPSQIQATKVMAVLDVLSSHSPDEEYLGKDPEPSWAENPVIMAAFERFSGKLKELEGIIDERNTDLNLKNRTGAGVVPYELLKPYSESGVTGMGVPNSISI